ncbi:MAG: efflux RND transporter periplasmic adaptor subunit [Methylophaga sp.]|nr:efflux RND transporter periplasmic adaptor subunit [Methylophaga sp.]
MRIPSPPSLVILMTSLLIACDSGAPLPEEKVEKLVRPAKLIEVGKTSDDVFLNYPAVIKSQQLSSLYFEVGGMVNELPVIQAQQVKKGDVLAKLDQRDLLAKLASAKATYNNANTEYQRGLRLLKEDAISKSKVGERKSNRDVAKSSVETAEKALQDSVLIAPYDGSIAKVDIKIRQVVQAGKPVIDILGKDGGLKAIINLPSSILAKSGGREPTTDSYIVLNAAPDRQIPVTFKEAALQADAASQTYEIVFTFEAPEYVIILPGMNGVVWLRDPTRSTSEINRIRIPLTAIATDGDQKYVWVVDQNTMTVSKRNVVIEANVGTMIGIISGLKPGDSIVATGISALSEGMKVSKWSK